MAEEEAETSWDNTVEEWLISEGYCYAGALSSSDGAFYAAAPTTAEDGGWGFVYKEDHEETMLNDDMTEKKTMVNEASTLAAAVKDGKTPPGGLWLGGNKYTVTNYDPAFESGDHQFRAIFANRPKKGVAIVQCTTEIIVGFYDEEKGQTGGNCRKAVFAFAEYLKGMGY